MKNSLTMNLSYLTIINEEQLDHELVLPGVDGRRLARQENSPVNRL